MRLDSVTMAIVMALGGIADDIAKIAFAAVVLVAAIAVFEYAVQRLAENSRLSGLWEWLEDVSESSFWRLVIPGSAVLLLVLILVLFLHAYPSLPSAPPQPLVEFDVGEVKPGRSAEAHLLIRDPETTFGVTYSGEGSETDLEDHVWDLHRADPAARFDAFLSAPFLNREKGLPEGQTVPADWRWSFLVPDDASGEIYLRYSVFGNQGGTAVYLGEGVTARHIVSGDTWWRSLASGTGDFLVGFWLPIVSGILIAAGGAVASTIVLRRLGRRV